MQTRIAQALCCILVCLTMSCVMPAMAKSGLWNPAKDMTSSTISAITQDNEGYIWVGTEYGLNRFDGYRYTYYLANAEDSCSLNDNCITTLYVDPAGNLWVGTRQGLNRYNPNADQFASVHFDNGWQPRIQQLCADEDGTLWCATSGFGLWRIKDNQAVEVCHPNLDHEAAYFQCIALDHDGHLWRSDQRGEVSRLRMEDERYFTEELNYDSGLGEVVSILPCEGDSIYFVCKQGLFCYDGQGFSTLAEAQVGMELSSALLNRDGEVVLGTLNNGLWKYTSASAHHYTPIVCAMDEIDVSAVSVHAVYEDKDGNCWVGCYQRGLLLLPALEVPFMTWSLSENQRPTGSEVTSVADVNQNTLLVTLSGKGLYELRKNTPAHACPCMADAMFVHFDQKNNRHWVATSTGICNYDPATGHARLVLPVQGANVRAMTTDKQGRLYVSNYSKGLLMYDPSNGQTRQLDMYHPLNDDPDDRLCNDWVQSLLTDSRGNIWCATAWGVCCYDPRAQTFCPYGWSMLLPDYLCQCLSEDADGNILVGTNVGLYNYDLRTRQLANVPMPGLGLMSRSVFGVVAMPDHTIWVSTSHGIWFYDPTDGVLRPYPHAEDPGRHEYNQGVGMLLRGGEIVFGQHDGLLLFHPENVRQMAFAPASVQLTAFVMNNGVVKPGQLSGGQPIFDCVVTQAHEFTLDYEDNTFTMEFSDMKYYQDHRTLLEYSVNNGRWQNVPDQSNVIAFNHMQPGAYELRVRTSYNNHYSDVTRYTIRIRPPWYQSAWAFVLYTLLLLAFIGVCVWLWLRHKRTQVEEEKMKLLIDATHDIRTPLTLILSPLHQLSERYQNEPDTANKLQTINHNARRILTLVNQILEVRRYDKQQMPFSPQLTDMVRLVKDNLHGFLYEAQQHQIDLQFHHDMPSPFNVMLDRAQFEKVIVNLVGNALKFTPDGGEIDLHLSHEGQNAVLRVSDTGVGLPDEDTERIFHRFYQATAANGGGEGTGIGLNLCLKIMQQHHGTISAASRQDGRKGSIFTVTLPMPTAAAMPAEVKPAQPATVRQPSRSQRILLVDDDQEITDYIAKELAGRYHFQTCRNGIEALQLLLADPTRFDVLVSDIMMSEMDGMTLLRSIKSNSQIAHIPVILLTSKTEIAHRLEGLSAGADAYMAKPFVIDELRATIDGLIANTLRHRSKFGGNVEAAMAATEQAADVVKSAMGPDADNKLLERIVKVVNEHLSQADFGVDELCSEVGVSRSQLHRKMKEMTGIGAGEFIRNIRLEQAARMLKETDMNVSQVAYAVGFSNLGHFSKIFRTHFGVYPSDYGKGE